MDSQIVAIYCLCDDILKAPDHRDDPQCHMTDAGVVLPIERNLEAFE
jgi:hypothetical protein